MPKSRKTNAFPAKMMSGKNPAINTASINAKRTGLSQASSWPLVPREGWLGIPKGDCPDSALSASPRNQSIMPTSRQFHANGLVVAKQSHELLVPVLHGPVTGSLAELLSLLSDLQRQRELAPFRVGGG